MMNQSSILFRFQDGKAALHCFDTLEELDYNAAIELSTAEEPQASSSDSAPAAAMIRVELERSDLTSALEIAQAHGGVLVEDAAEPANEVYASAYGLDEIPIPAHVVNEDWTPDYATGQAADPDEDNTPYDAESLNYFSTDVHV